MKEKHSSFLYVSTMFNFFWIIFKLSEFMINIKMKWCLFSTFFFIHLKLMYNLIPILNFSMSCFKYDMSVYFVFISCSMMKCQKVFFVISAEIFKIDVQMFWCSVKLTAVFVNVVMIMLFLIVFLMIIMTIGILTFSNALLILFLIKSKTIFI